MKLNELKNEVKKFQYLEDTGIIDVTLASIIATRLKLGDPVWLVIIGASSGGKSQILRPMSLTDAKFLHRVDDLTENTFLSGMKAKEGEKVSLLDRVGSQGMLVISDFTVIFSKASEARNAILSQFRMIYDGEMTKSSGNSSKPIMWKGYLGVIAGSTPSIYRNFEEVADMGERFIYYRMKDYDPEKATRLALTRKVFGRDLDEKLSKLYADYIKDVCLNAVDQDVKLSDRVHNRIIEVAMMAERVRTSVHIDSFSKDITNIPIPAMPMRVALQLESIAKALALIAFYERKEMELTDQELSIIDWCGYSLANEEKRACLKVLASVDFDESVSTQTIADRIGLSTGVTKNFLQGLSATKVLTRMGSMDGGNSLRWKFTEQNDYDVIRRIEHIETIEHLEEREMTTDEVGEINETPDLDELFGNGNR